MTDPNPDSLTPPPGVTPVPLPAGGALLVAAPLGLGVLRRKANAA